MHDEAEARERLRAMRHLTTVRDGAALDQQVRRLRALGHLPPECFHALTEAITQEAFGAAAALIEVMLVEWPAAPVQAPRASEDAPHRIDLNALEEELAAREREEAELRKTLHAFNARYRDELGPLVSKLLRLRKERTERSLYARRSDHRRQSARSKAEAQFERFQSMLEDTEDPPPNDLSDDEETRLKTIYRRASKQCHPDMVDPSVEDEARSYFNALQEAYQHNDVQRVKQIADTLKVSGFARRADASPSSPAQHAARAERLRRRIASVEEALEEIRSSDAYQVITRTDDLEAYFEALKQKLRREIRRLHRGRSVG
jgi:hypothetical protein